MTTASEIREAEARAKGQREALAALRKPCVDCPGAASLLCCGRVEAQKGAGS